jgi:aspartyl-tRNA(Asn)/glutamyl-tRNA(Gln) amidotransferase subunit B
VQQTFDYHVDTNRLTPRRTKETADDYRYFPEPDLVPVEPDAHLVERARPALEDLPAARIRRVEQTLGLESAVGLVTAGRDRLWQDVVAAGAEATAAANVLMNPFAATGVDPGTVDAGELAKLIGGRDTIPRATFAEALAASGDAGFAADRYLAEATVSDTAELDPVIERVLAANPGQVEQYRGGKHGLLGFFVGQVMRETQGKADARVVNELLRAKLDS